MVASLLLGGFSFGSVLPAEAFDATRCVHQLLLPSEVGMAVGANLQVKVTLVGRTGAERVPAGAYDADVVICGMDGWLHVDFNLDSSALILQERATIQQPGN